METKTEKKRHQFTIVELLVVIALIGTLYTLIKPVRSVAREAARRSACSNNQKEIMRALLDFEKKHGRFPPACMKDQNGNPTCSWRVSILPFTDQQELYEKVRLDEPWDSDHNKKVTGCDVDLFKCPTVPEESLGATNYVLVTGPGTVWDGDKPCSLEDITYPEQTLILIETSLNIPWAKPKDLRIDAIDPDFLNEKGNFKCHHPGGAIGAFADGHTEFICEEDIPKSLQEWSQVKQKKREEE